MGYKDLADEALKVAYPVGAHVSRMALYCFDQREEWVAHFLRRYPRLVGVLDSRGNGLLMWAFWSLQNRSRLDGPLDESRRAPALRLVELLLAAGADPRCTDRQGYHFTHFLCRIGDAEALAFCAARGICRWDAPTESDALPLDYLLISGHIALFERYRDCGEVSSNALHLIAYNSDDPQTVEFALSLPQLRRTLNFFCADPTGSRWTPLMCAVRGGRTATARLLIAAGARADLAAPSGTTALELLLRNFGSKEQGPPLLQELVNAGADPNAPFAKGERPVEWAVRRGRAYVLESLLALEGPAQVQLASAAEGTRPLPLIALASKKVEVMARVLVEMAGRAGLPCRSAAAAALRLGFPECAAALLCSSTSWSDLPHLLEQAVLAGSWRGFRLLLHAPAAALHRCDWTEPLAAALRADDPRFAEAVLAADPALVVRCPPLVRELAAGRATAFRIALKFEDSICWEFVREGLLDCSNAAGARRALLRLPRTHG